MARKSSTTQQLGLGRGLKKQGAFFAITGSLVMPQHAILPTLSNLQKLF